MNPPRAARVEEVMMITLALLMAAQDQDPAERYAIENPDTVVEWATNTMAYAGRDVSVIVDAGGHVVLVVAANGPGFRAEDARREEFEMRPEQLDRMVRIFMDVEFLDAEQLPGPTRMEDMVVGGRSWSISYQPAGAEAHIIRSPTNGVDVPESLQPIEQFFLDLIDNTDEYRQSDEG